MDAQAEARPAIPKRVVYKTYWLRYDGAYWARIDTVEDAAAPARIEAELRDGGKLRVAVENADRFHLDLAKELVGDAPRSWRSASTARQPFKAPPGRTVYFAKTAGKWARRRGALPAGAGQEARPVRARSRTSSWASRC